MATYGPGIDQSQHAKSVSHITTVICTVSMFTIRSSLLLSFQLYEHKLDLEFTLFKHNNVDIECA